MNTIRIAAFVVALMLCRVAAYGSRRHGASLRQGGLSMNLGGAFGAGLVILGAGLGIGELAPPPLKACRASRKWPATFRPR